MDVGLPIKTRKDPPCTRTARKESYRLLGGREESLEIQGCEFQDPRIRKLHESKEIQA